MLVSLTMNLIKVVREENCLKLNFYHFVVSSQTTMMVHAIKFL